MSHTRLIWLLTLLLLAGSTLGVAWLSGAPFAFGGTPAFTLPPPPPHAARPAPVRPTHRAARPHAPHVAPAAPAAPAASAVEAPGIVTTSAPHYPIAALRGHHEGVTVVHVQVDADGQVEAATLAQSSGWPELDQAAVESVRQWRFRAARRDGQAIDGALDVPVRFRIDAGGG
ncbi:MAG: energy transducer TonB [Mizugakiibacter sp.]|uniref:energy transducer TonB n=1 Tax=Mizugakiibacter sp. TaxID=1972610 RepID=UPI0027F3BE6A|nr:energy transducer TonB [Actinomycetes bacterium]